MNVLIVLGENMKYVLVLYQKKYFVWQSNKKEDYDS